MPTNKERAVELLTHYFRLFAEKSGVQWDGDNDSEIFELVDAIIDAAVEDNRNLAVDDLPSFVKPAALR